MFHASEEARVERPSESGVGGLETADGAIVGHIGRDAAATVGPSLVTQRAPATPPTRTLLPPPMMRGGTDRVIRFDLVILAHHDFGSGSAADGVLVVGFFQMPRIGIKHGGKGRLLVNGPAACGGCACGDGGRSFGAIEKIRGSVSQFSAGARGSLAERVGRSARNRGSNRGSIFVGFMVSVHL